MDIKKVINNFKALFTKDIGNILTDPFLFNQLYSNGSITQPMKTNSTVYSAVRAIIDNINQADIGFFDFATNKEIWPDDLRKLFKNPNPVMATDDFLEAIAVFYNLYNEVIIIKTMNTIGQLSGTQLPSELWPMNPKKFSCIKTTDNNYIWQCNGRTFTSNEIIYIGKFNPYSDTGRPFSATDPIQNDLDIDYQRLAYNANFFKNGGKPGYIMTTDQKLTNEARTQLHSDWIKNYKGVSKAGKLAIFDQGLKFEDTGGVSHSDMQFQEQRVSDKETILGIFRVPKVILSMTDNIQYATFQGQMKAFWLYTLHPQLKRISNAFNTQLIEKIYPNIEMRFKYENVPVYKEEFEKSVDVAQKLMNMGIPFNKVNDKLNLGFDPLPWGDDWWMSMGLIPASQYEQYNTFNAPADNSSDSKIMFKTDASDKYDRKIAGMFLKRHGHFEIVLAPKVKSFFFWERAKILELSAKGKFNPNTYNFEDDKRKLIISIRPMIEKILTDGIAFGRELVPGGKSISKLAEQEIQRNIDLRMVNIAGITDTIARQLRQQITDAIIEGEPLPTIQDIIRGTFNAAASRSMTIARTETTGALNNGTFLYWKDLQIMYKTWLAYNDEFTREEHRELSGQTVPMTDNFSNGLKYPGDQSLGRSEESAKQVINCRCNLAPRQTR